MSRYVLTPAAEDDLLQIFDYLQGENPSAVLRVVNAIEQAVQLLADSPKLGHVRLDLTREDVRFWPVFSYLVVYRSDTNPLEIVRVLHGKRDVRWLLDQ